MTNLVLHRESTDQAIALPEPRQGPINIRVATLDDIPFIDALQKQHNKMVGFFPRVWFENNIKTGHVLIAEEATADSPALAGRGSGGGSNGVSDEHALQSVVRPTHPPAPSLKGGGVPAKPLGYCVYRDKYLKREELGIVYQLNVTPGKQRGLIGASLVKAAFERCPYGVKLFCCWCAQDIQANHFWESIGFVPIAFRTGSRPRKRKDGTISKPERIHIFWQRRIRAEENQANTGETPVPLTPYWFPSETSGGAVRENRIVLPIPPGTHWSDAKPSVLPGFVSADAGEGAKPLPLQPHPRRKRERKASAAPSLPAKAKGGLWFGPSPAEVAAAKAQAKEHKKREKPAKRKNDPKYVAAARELRDRYLEEANAPGSALLLAPASHGKYDVSRMLAPGIAASTQRTADKLLDAA